MKIHSIVSKALVSAAFFCFSTASHASFIETFDGTALPAGWVATNVSTRNATGNPWSVATGITDDTGALVVAPHSGSGMAVANYTSVGGTTGTGTINNWLISPLITGMRNGDTFSFYTTTTPASDYPDRLEFRMSTGSGTNVGTTVTGVGTFTTNLLSVNSGLNVGGYPELWTQYTVTLSGLSAPVDGRVAFRYFVTSGGPSGINSNIIGVDNFRYTSVADATSPVPEPGSITLLLAGAGLFAAMRHRRNKAA